MTNRKRAIITCFLMVSLLVSCSGGSDNASPAGTGSGGVATVSPEDARLAQLLLYQGDDAAEYTLTERLIHACMAKSSFPYHMTVYKPRYTVRSGPGGSLELRESNGFGYAVEPPTPSAADEQKENTAHAAKYGQAWANAMQACNEQNSVAFGKRSQKLNDSLSAKTRKAIDDLQYRYMAEVEALQPKWAACMKGKGFSFASQEKMHKELEAAVGTPGAADKEIAAAVADYKCEASTLSRAKSKLYAGIVAKTGGVAVLGDPYATSWAPPSPN